ncbi:hypothetical protein H1C71_005854 [Ictidomys tridecemlineatus]|nr:hypothetical protein H1C71_005854 [Ictidomys tridecemlineatus]
MTRESRGQEDGGVVTRESSQQAQKGQNSPTTRRQDFQGFRSGEGQGWLEREREGEGVGECLFFHPSVPPAHKHGSRESTVTVKVVVGCVLSSRLGVRGLPDHHGQRPCVACLKLDPDRRTHLLKSQCCVSSSSAQKSGRGQQALREGALEHSPSPGFGTNERTAGQDSTSEKMLVY